MFDDVHENASGARGCVEHLYYRMLNLDKWIHVSIEFHPSSQCTVHS